MTIFKTTWTGIIWKFFTATANSYKVQATCYLQLCNSLIQNNISLLLICKNSIQNASYEQKFFRLASPIEEIHYNWRWSLRANSMEPLPANTTHHPILLILSIGQADWSLTLLKRYSFNAIPDSRIMGSAKVIYPGKVLVLSQHVVSECNAMICW